MTAEEMLKTMRRLFFPVLGVSFLAVLLVAMFLGASAVPVRSLMAIPFFTLVCILSLGLFYSKRELTKGHIIARYILNFAFTLCVLVAIYNFVWVDFQFSYLIVIAPLHVVGYIVLAVYDEMRVRRLSGVLTEKLKDYQKSA